MFGSHTTSEQHSVEVDPGPSHPSTEHQLKGKGLSGRVPGCLWGGASFAIPHTVVSKVFIAMTLDGCLNANLRILRSPKPKSLRWDPGM